MIAVSLAQKGFGRSPLGRAIRSKSSLVPRCGLYAAIPNALSFRIKVKFDFCNELFEE